MTLPWLPVLQAEWKKLLHQRASWAALLLTLLLSLGCLRVVAAIRTELSSEESAVPAFLQSFLSVDDGGLMIASLQLRSFVLFLPPLLLWLCAQSVAVELREGQLREALLGPLPRWQLLLSKGAVLVLGDGLLLLVQLVVIGLGTLWLPAWTSSAEDLGLPLVVQAALGVWACDVCLIGFGLCLSTFSRSSAGVVVGMSLVLTLDLMTRGVVKGLSVLGLVSSEGWEWLPGEALSAWDGYGGNWEPAALIGLVLWTLLTWGVTLRRLERRDLS